MGQVRHVWLGPEDKEGQCEKGIYIFLVSLKTVLNILSWLLS